MANLPDGQGLSRHPGGGGVVSDGAFNLQEKNSQPSCH